MELHLEKKHFAEAVKAFNRIRRGETVSRRPWTRSASLWASLSALLCACALAYSLPRYQHGVSWSAILAFMWLVRTYRRR